MDTWVALRLRFVEDMPGIDDFSRNGCNKAFRGENCRAGLGNPDLPSARIGLSRWYPVGTSPAMSVYRTNVAVLDVPDSWHDQSIVAFKLPAAPGGGDGSFVITKDAGKGVTPFPAYLDKQTDNCRRSLPGYRELKREMLHANGHDAAWLEFQWVNDRTTIQLRQIFFDCGFFSVICTLTAAPGDIAYHEAEWQRVMSSLVFDAPAITQQFP